MRGEVLTESDRSRRALFAALLIPILGAVVASASAADSEAASIFGIGCLVVGGVAWILSVRLARSGIGDVSVVIAGAILLRVLAFAVGTPRSDDAYRYLWEGELVLQGASPYAVAPIQASASVATLEVRSRFPELWSRVSHKEVSAAYPPLAQGVGAAAAATSRLLGLRPEIGGIRLLRAFFGMCDLLVLLPLLKLLDRARLPRTLAVAWGWSPLASIEFARSAHLDSLAILLLLAALASATGGIRSLVFLSGGILTKYLPAVALPWLARGRRPVVRAGLVLSLVALAFAPFLLLGASVEIASGLRDYAFRWESASLVHRFVEGFFARFHDFDESARDPRRLARAAEAVVWLVLAIVQARRDRDPVRGCAALLGAWLVLSPTLHPWYLCWMLPFVAFRPSAAWSWLLVAAPLLDVPYARWVREGVWNEPAWLWPVLALPFFALWIRQHALGRAEPRVAVPSAS